MLSFPVYFTPPPLSSASSPRSRSLSAAKPLAFCSFPTLLPCQKNAIQLNAAPSTACTLFQSLLTSRLPKIPRIFFRFTTFPTLAKTIGVCPGAASPISPWLVSRRPSSGVLSTDRCSLISDRFQSAANCEVSTVNRLSRYTGEFQPHGESPLT